jgi:2-succinyl-5-enolpyruvyl-6-hydroxy-3-cyclohexene-1-carboxylate synthase
MGEKVQTEGSGEIINLNVKDILKNSIFVSNFKGIMAMDNLAESVSGAISASVTRGATGIDGGFDPNTGFLGGVKPVELGANLSSGSLDNITGGKGI